MDGVVDAANDSPGIARQMHYLSPLEAELLMVRRADKYSVLRNKAVTHIKSAQIFLLTTLYSRSIAV